MSGRNRPNVDHCSRNMANTFADIIEIGHSRTVELKTHMSFAYRIRVLVVVLSSLFAAFVPLVVFGSEGLWWAEILFIGSVPLIIILTVLTIVFAYPIANRPYRWAAIAGLSSSALSTLALWMVTKTFVGLASLAVVIPAVGVFMALVKCWPNSLRPPNSPKSGIAGPVIKT